MSPGPTPEPPPTVKAPLFVPTMHGIRGAAIFIIVLFHIAGGTSWVPGDAVPRALYESGFMAVDVLFFTTGFVLFLPVVVNGTLGSVGAFAIRRLARIPPPYYVCLALVGLLYPLLSTPAIERLADRGLTEYLLHFTFLNWVVMPLEAGFIVNHPVWSLTIDVAFYFLLPLIALAYLRHPLGGLAVALAVSVAWRAAFIQPHTPPAAQDKLGLLVQFPFFLADFACGMTAVWAFVRLRQRNWSRLHTRATVIVTLCALSALLVLAYLAGSNLPYRLGAYQQPVAVFMLFPLTLLVFVVALSLSPPWMQWPLTNRVSLWFAEISYSVFLYHYALIFFANFTLGIPRDGDFPWLMGAFVLPACLVIATLSYFLIERPARRYGRRLARRVSGGGPAPAGTERARASTPLRDPA